MSSNNTSIMAHVSIGTNDIERSVEFYDALLPVVGAKRLIDVNLDEPGLVAVGYGKKFPEFWVNLPLDGKAANTGNGVHFAFQGNSRDDVHTFWDVAIKAGAVPDGEPGPRPDYGDPYYGCFLRDPDGHKIECMYWDRDLE